MFSGIEVMNDSESGQLLVFELMEVMMFERELTISSLTHEREQCKIRHIL